MANILSLLNLMVIFWLSLNSTSGKICPRFVGTGIKLLSTNNQSFSCGSYDAFTCETECHTCVASILITGSYRLFGMVIVRSYDDFPDSFINLNGQISVDCRSRFLTVGRVIGAFGSRIDVETDSTVEISNLNIWEWGVLHVGSNVTIGETVSSAVRTITVGAKSTLSIHNSLTSVTRVLLDNTELSIGRNSPSVFDFGGISSEIYLAFKLVRLFLYSTTLQVKL